MACFRKGITSQKYNGVSCAELIAEAKSVDNELAKRKAELEEDVLNLPKTGEMSLEGHVDQMSGKQVNQRNRLIELETRPGTGCCSDRERIPQCWRHATREIPREAELQSNTDVVEIAKYLGLGLTVVAGVFFAPEIAAVLSVARVATAIRAATVARAAAGAM